MTTLRIATRQSKLALWQAEHVAASLRAAHPSLQVELVKMTTQGDRVLDRPLAEIGGKGLFIKELEVALAEGRADIAVHSMKDVPSELPPGMLLAAMLPRADARDAFVSTHYPAFDALPQGARVGTSSLRRQCQIRAVRGDLQLIPLRGNVDTRLRKLEEGEFDAIILASAGLIRLGLGDRIKQFLSVEQSLPAVGQGIIGIECRSEDFASQEYVRILNDLDANSCIAAERAFALRLEGSCQSPIGGFAELSGVNLKLHGLVASIDGAEVYRDTLIGPRKNAVELGRMLAERILFAGADRLLREFRAQAAHQSLPPPSGEHR
ncbi:MAG TPA: hydroxymethylbilane synthase [Steroidobacteraceae bacterium]|nr:hydroxymethylbilane synthase [Steroidobacteraceae bacterium]